MPRNRLHTTILAGACAGVVALVGWNAGAESAASAVALAEPTTVAVVNVEQALNQLDELKDLNKKLEERVKGRQQDLDNLKNQLEDLQAQLDQLPTNDQEKRRTLRAQIYELRETAAARASVYQSLINIEKGEIIRPLYTKFTAAVEEISQKQGYDLVLFDDTAIEIPQDTDVNVNRAIQQKRIIYAADNLDITNEVILLMNQKYKTGAK